WTSFPALRPVLGDFEAAVDQRQRVDDLLVVRSGDGRRPVDGGGAVAVGGVAAIGLHVHLVLGDHRVARSGDEIGDLAQPVAGAVLRGSPGCLLAGWPGWPAAPRRARVGLLRPAGAHTGCRTSG